MAKCEKCGKKGLFLKLIDGVCSNCYYESKRPITKPKTIQPKSAVVPKNNIDLAEQVMNSLSLGGSVISLYSKDVSAIKTKYQTQGKISAHAAELCGEPNTIKGYYVKSLASEWAGAKYRKETIKWTLKWIESGLEFSGMDRRYPQCTVRQSLEYDAYLRLGQALEGEYMFEEALTAYQKGFAARPSAYSLIIKMSKVLVKMNKLDEAIDLVGNATFPDGIEKNLQTETLKELHEKKAKGYVYKPRKKPAV